MTREEILAVAKIIYSDDNTINNATKMITKMAENVSMDFSKMDLSQFITETNQPAVRMWSGINPIYGDTLRPHISCEDGTRLSIQASSSHYCLPREDWLDKYDSYEMVILDNYDLKELLKKQKKLKLKEAVQWFIDNDPNPEDRDEDSFPEPFSFVPHDILQGLIDACGGIKGIRN